MKRTLSCCSASIPAEDLEGKLTLAGSLGLALEYEYTSHEGVEEFASLVKQYEVGCPTVMAYPCHDLNPLSDIHQRRSFISCIIGAARAARLAGAEHILTAVYEGHDVPDAEQVASELYAELSRRIPDRWLLIESLSRKRTVFLPDVDGIVGFVSRMNNARIGIVVDTWHMFNAAEDITAALERHAPRIHTVHLKDSDSRAPGEGYLDFDHILASLRKGGFSGNFTIECRTPDSVVSFQRSVKRIKLLMDKHF